MIMAKPRGTTTGCNLSIKSLIAAVMLLCLLVGPRPTAAQTTLSDLSTCGLSCLAEGISRSNCTALDVACQCASEVVADVVTDCLLANCTMQDTLNVSRFTASECNLPNNSRSTEVIVVMSALWGGSLIFVVLRCVSKFLTGVFSAEDHVLVVALLLAVAPMGCVMHMAVLGFGGHVWDLQDGALLQILRLFYVAEIIYITTLALTKVSIVLMYIRIFSSYRPFRITCYGVLAFVVVPSAVITLLTILSCRPIPYFWDRDMHGRCLNTLALAYANSAFAMTQDVLLIVLPIFMLARLQMSLKKKLLIAIMFAVGGLGLVATIIRLGTLHVFSDFQDPTWDWIPLVYWTTTELAAGIICSSLPAVRMLLDRFSVFQLNTIKSSESSSRDRGVAIRMERRRVPTADGALQARWKESGFVVEENGESERGLTAWKDWGQGA